MKRFLEVRSLVIDEKKMRGKVICASACPFGAGHGVTIRKAKAKNTQRMNVTAEKVSGNTFEFDVPQDNPHFTRPNFSSGPVWISYQ